METFFEKQEVAHYLNFLENSSDIADFLSYDSCFRLADNYLLALIFIYFKRAGLKCDDFTQTNFYAALLLAHAMVEESEENIKEVWFWALPRGLQDRAIVAQMETVKMLMFQAMGFRGYVSKDCCNLVMSTISHSLWKRQRNAVHGGTSREGPVDNKCSKEKYNWITASCSLCRNQRKKLFGEHNH